MSSVWDVEHTHRGRRHESVSPFVPGIECALREATLQYRSIDKLQSRPSCLFEKRGFSALWPRSTDG